MSIVGRRHDHRWSLPIHNQPQSRGKMNATELLSQLKADAAAGRSLDFRAIREQIHDASERTSDSGERIVLLQVFHAVMDLTERSGNIAPEGLEVFKDTRAKDYRLLLMREVLVGQNVSVELLNAVTHREVQAGRMPEDDEFRQLAVKGLTEPYLSVQQLLKIEQDRLAADSKPTGWRRWFGKK